MQHLSWVTICSHWGFLYFLQSVQENAFNRSWPLLPNPYHLTIFIFLSYSDSASETMLVSNLRIVILLCSLFLPADFFFQEPERIPRNCSSFLSSIHDYFWWHKNKFYKIVWQYREPCHLVVLDWKGNCCFLVLKYVVLVNAVYNYEENHIFITLHSWGLFEQKLKYCKLFYLLEVTVPPSITTFVL